MASFNLFSNFLSNDLAIDLGTANTLIWMKNKGIILNEPSIVAYESNTREIKAIGNEAQAMVGRTHKDIKTAKPMMNGAIADFEIAEGMIRAFIRKVSNSWQPARRIIVSIPAGLTNVEKRAVRDSCEHAGAKEVHLIPEPMASAIGIGLDVKESVGNMIVDIGGGTTEIAVISLGGIVKSTSIRTAGNEMTNAIIEYYNRNYGLMIGERTAEQIKCAAGSAVPLEEEIEFEIKGRDKNEGLPKSIVSSSVNIREALNDCIREIVNGVLGILEQTPPELSSDILERGIMLSGGGAMLKGLDQKISNETKLFVHIANEPLTTVVRGVGKVLENFSEYADVLIKTNRY